MHSLRLALVPLVLAIALGLSADPAVAGDRDFERALEKAQKYLSKDKLDKAIPYFVKANDLAGGTCRDCLQGLGIAARRSRDFEQALDAYEGLLNLGGAQAFGALQRVIRLSVRIGDPLRGAAACHVFLEAGEMTERQAAWALNELGLLLVASNDAERLDEASSAFYAALGRQGDASKVLRVNAAEIEWRLGREGTARALLDTMSPEEPGGSPSFRQIELTIDGDPAIARRLRETEQRQRPIVRPQGWKVVVPSSKRWRHVAGLDSVDAVVSHLVEDIGVDASIRDRAVACAASVAPEELNARLVQAGWPGPFLGSTGVKRPEVAHAAQPEYTDIALHARVQGQVQLTVVVDDDGRVSYATAFKSLPMGLGSKGVEAARRWRFEPATRDGRPLAVCENIDIDFRLQ